jgi:thioredoxin
MAVQSVTDATFEEVVLNATVPVLIDFYADWCQPCKAIAPLLEDLSEEYAGAVLFVKVDVEANPAVMQAFRIQSMPTIMLLQDRQLVDAIVGARGREEYEALLQRVATKPARVRGVETFDAQRLKLTLEAEMAVPVDVRVAADYARTRIPGAIHVPASEVAERTAELNDPSMTYVFYGRTNEGVHEAAKAALDAGVAAGLLDGGLLAWESELLPVEKPS